MKGILSILIRIAVFPAFLMGSIAVHGQSLTFNQVILMNAGQMTVPAGKAWKLEKVMMPDTTFIKYTGQSGGTCGCNSGGGYAHVNYASTPISDITLDNILVNGKAYTFDNNTPLWLPAGTIVKPKTLVTPVQQSTPSSGCYCPYWIDGAWVGYGPYTPPQVTVTSLISLIEFNIVP